MVAVCHGEGHARIRHWFQKRTEGAAHFAASLFQKLVSCGTIIGSAEQTLLDTL